MTNKMVLVPIYEPGRWLNDMVRPERATFASAGRFTVPFEGGRFDRHYHDTAEVWFIANGRAKVLVDGEERYVQDGDIVLTLPGDPHDVLEVYATVRGFFAEAALAPGGRFGHLHADPADAAGHDVPACPLPDDFPLRDNDAVPSINVSKPGKGVHR